MSWGAILAAFVKYIGVAAFMLSVINLGVAAFFRRTKIQCADVVFTTRLPDHPSCFLELTLIN